MADMKSSKLFHCMFYVDIECSHRLFANFYVMDRCEECPHGKRFYFEMAHEDEKEMDEIEALEAKYRRCLERK